MSKKKNINMILF